MAAPQTACSCGGAHTGERARSDRICALALGGDPVRYTEVDRTAPATQEEVCIMSWARQGPPPTLVTLLPAAFHPLPLYFSKAPLHKAWPGGLKEAGTPGITAELEQRSVTVETHAAFSRDRHQELLYLRSKMIDLEDRSRRDNVQFLGFLETIEGTDMHSFLRETLPKLTGLTLDPPDFQRAHRLGPKQQDAANRPCPIIACSCDTRRPANSYREPAHTDPAGWTDRRSG
ncbi:hypothetical protein NDU88_002992 [Pleurodeles waltl]|uniref:Uncharacterized protein n=1 Tax=Pleurodeles waltl TaxID=8319 RepID=A0AAV7RCM1_PLEWA|nr:hypothetical protein NDU88_002992 [Pleurodeles waltl]